MKRRDFLKRSGIASLSACISPHALSQVPRSVAAMMPGPTGRSWSWPTGLPLEPVRTLANQSDEPGEFAATLTADRYRSSIVSGATTELWGYNGAFPGPLIELFEGQHASIDFANRLDIDSTIHWHGLRVPPDQDGSPLEPVVPMGNRKYSFDVLPGSSGTYWYHPHAHGTVAMQVGHGLLAPLIVRRLDDPLRDIPELTLVISSLALDPSAQVVTTASMNGMGGGAGAMMSSAGLLVNGQRAPVYASAPGATERWRIINATADRYLRIGLDGHRFAVVATDGGLLGQPLPDLTEWLLAPAQRVEIVVRLAEPPSTRYALRDLGYSGGSGAFAATELMSVLTTGTPIAKPIVLPPVLRNIADEGFPTVRQRIVLSAFGMGMMGSFLINGRTFDPGRTDLVSVVDRVELWDIENTTMMDHPIHVHGTQFQITAATVRGLPEPVSYAAWLDTVNVPAGGTVTIKIRQTMPGKRMVHCHILPHEDAGMMAVLDVRSN